MIKRHPFRALGTVLGVAVAFFLLSAIGQSNGYWKSGPTWLGAIGWFSFLICLLVLIVLAIYLVIAKLGDRRRGRELA